MKIKLNCLNKVISRDTSRVHPLTEYEFWRLYLELLDIKAKALTARNKDVMAFILAGDPYKSYFRGDAGKDLNEHFNFSRVSRHLHQKALMSAGYITYTLEDAKSIRDNRGDILVSPSLRAFQLYVKRQIQSDLEIEFVFPTKIIDDGTGNRYGDKEVYGVLQVERM